MVMDKMRVIRSKEMDDKQKQRKSVSMRLIEKII